MPEPMWQVEDEEGIRHMQKGGRIVSSKCLDLLIKLDKTGRYLGTFFESERN